MRSISEYWDVYGCITGDSIAEAEYRIYLRYLASAPSEELREVWLLSDFENYINRLKEGESNE